MLVRMSTASVASDAGTLGGVATRLSTAASTLVSSLNGCSGMAGIDPMAEEFAQGAEQEGGYDRSAQAMAKSGVTLAQAVAGLEQYVLGLSAAYRAMELAGADGGANPYQNMSATTVSSYVPSVSTSLGDEHRGTAGGEVMEWIENFLKDNAGIVIPTAETGKVRDAASAWDAYEASLNSASSSVSAALPVTLAADFPQRDAVSAVRDRLAELIDDTATDAGKLADGCRAYAQNVDDIRAELLSMLGQLALEVAIDIGVGVALSFFSFGAGALAGMAKAAATVARWIPKIVSVLNRLKSLIRVSKRLMALMRRAAIEAIEATVSGTIANAGASIAFGNFSWTNLGGAAVSSGIGGVFTGPFSHIGASSTSRVVRVTTQGGVQGVTGGAGGIVGEWTASQLTGQEFNIVMSALVGTVGGTASGGIGGIASPSSTSGAGGAGGQNTDVPTIGGTGGSGGSGGSSSGAGGGTPAASTTTTDAPTPGAGAPASTTGSSGGGSGVPQSDAPTAAGGSGGSGGSANSGGTSPVDTSSTPVDVPSSLPADAPTATDLPAGGDTTAGASDAGGTDSTAPETTAPETTAPETTAPEATAPETTTPDSSSPDSTTPDASSAGDGGDPDGSAAPATAGAGAGTAAGVGAIPTVDLPDSLGGGAGGGVPPVGGGRGPSDPDDTPIFHDTENALGIDYDDLINDIDNILDGSAADAVASPADGSPAGDGTADAGSQAEDGSHDGDTGDGGQDGDGDTADGAEDADSGDSDGDSGDGTDADDAAAPPVGPVDPTSDTDIPPAAVRDEIVDTPKGERPDPTTYLPADYIEAHLGRFDEGGTRFMTQSNLDKYGIAQRDGTAFVMPRSEVDALIERTGGDPRAMEDALGLPEGFFDNGAVRVDIDGVDEHGIRMPSGNEAGANDLWVPGGRLPGGFSEAVIDAGDIPPGDVHVTPMGGTAAPAGADPATPDAPAGRAPAGGAAGAADPVSSSPDPADPAAAGRDGTTDGDASTTDPDAGEGGGREALSAADADGSAGDGDPAGGTDPSDPTDATASADVETVPDTNHHPLLDQAFPHLDIPETRVEAIDNVNSAGYGADPDRYGNNCHFVVNALELRMRGYDVIASPTVGTSIFESPSGQWRDSYEARWVFAIESDWRQADGTLRSFQNLSDSPGDTPLEALESLTSSWPVGGRGFIGGTWTSGAGHIFTVVREADGVHLYDGQVNRPDAAAYLNSMHFAGNPAPGAPPFDMYVMRVDDLVPTEAVLDTAMPATPENLDRIDRSTSAVPVADRHQDAVPSELSANERWRARNEELISWRESWLTDPGLTDAQRARLSDEIRILQDQNNRLLLGHQRLEMEALTGDRPMSEPFWTEDLDDTIPRPSGS